MLISELQPYGCKQQCDLQSLNNASHRLSTDKSWSYRERAGFNVGMVQFYGLRHPFGISKKLLGVVSKYCYACNALTYIEKGR